MTVLEYTKTDISG